MEKFFNLDNPVMRTLSRIADLLWLNFLVVICCIPIVTAGASLTAMYYVTMKMVKNEENYITKMFFKAFKDNFKNSTIIGLLFIAGIVIIRLDFWVMGKSTAKFAEYVKYPVMFLAFMMLLIYLYVFALQARFENTVKNTIKNSFLLSVTNLHYTFGLAILQIIPWVALYYLESVAILIVLFLGVAGIAYLSSFAYVAIFFKIEKNMEESALESEDVPIVTEEDNTQESNNTIQ